MAFKRHFGNYMVYTTFSWSAIRSLARSLALTFCRQNHFIIIIIAHAAAFFRVWFGFHFFLMTLKIVFGKTENWNAFTNILLFYVSRQTQQQSNDDDDDDNETRMMIKMMNNEM